MESAEEGLYQRRALQVRCVEQACPLTVWEDLLRGGTRTESFIGRWLQRLLFYQAPEWVFTAAYLAWAAASAATLALVPPRRKAG